MRYVPLNPSRAAVAAVLLLLGAAASAASGPAPTAPAWWNANWPFRLVVQVIPQSARSGINTAGISLSEQSRLCRPDGGDVRVVDQSGQVVPSEAAVGEDGAIALDFLVGESTVYAIYYGNKDAQPQKTPWQKTLGGLELETRPIRKPVYEWQQIMDAVNENEKPYGRKPWRQIYDLQNPFGPDEMYLSIYTGTIYCPRSGEYLFATNSDDCSVAYIDDLPNPVCARRVGNPSERWDDPDYPMAVGKLELAEGVHRVRYYQVENTGGQLAHFGWRKPDEDVISTVPPRSFITTLPVQILLREQRGKAMNAYFDYEHLYNLRINNSEQWFPMFRLWSCSGEAVSPPTKADQQWTFGDSAPASGAEVLRDFLYDPEKPESPKVTLSLRRGDETDSITRALEVSRFPVQYMDLLMEVEAGPPIVALADTVAVKAFVKNHSRLTRDFDFKTLVESSGRNRMHARTLTLEPDEKTGAEWRTIETRVEPSDSNVHITHSIHYHGLKLVERRVAVLRTDLPLGRLWLDVNQRLRQGDDHYAVLRLADVRVGRGTAPRKLSADGVVNVLVVDNGLADAAGDAETAPSYLALLEGLFARESRSGGRRRPEFKFERVSPDQHGGYPPIERLCQVVTLLPAKSPNLVLITTSPEDVVNNIPLRDFSISLTALIDQVLTQTTALPIVLTPPPLPRTAAVARTYAREVKMVGLRKGIPVVDLYSGFAVQPDWLDLFSARSGSSVSYSLRPGRAGQELIARMVFEQMMRTVSSGAGEGR